MRRERPLTDQSNGHTLFAPAGLIPSSKAYAVCANSRLSPLLASKPRSLHASLKVALSLRNRPDVGGDRGDVVVRQSDPAERRHCACMLLWLRYPAFDDIRDALKASVAPKPSAERGISANRRANAARALTPGAGCPGNFVVKDLLAKRDLVARCSWRYRQAGIGVNAFRRHSFMRSLGFDRRSGRGLNF